MSKSPFETSLAARLKKERGLHLLPHPSSRDSFDVLAANGTLLINGQSLDYISSWLDKSKPKG
jgi:hypothetical protein